MVGLRDRRLVGAALRVQLEYEATFARVERFALALQLRGAWLWVLSTSFLWIEHCVARGSCGSCFLDNTLCWYARQETLLCARPDESCRLELCMSVVRTGLAGVLWL